LTIIDGPDQPQAETVQWKGRHVVNVLRYKHVWIDQDDAQVRLLHVMPCCVTFFQAT
jgi:hypothetical protein